MVERFLKPTSVAEALRARAETGGLFLAGGTELNWRGAPTAAAVVSLSGLGLDAIDVAADVARIGATVTLQRLVDSVELREAGLGVLCDAAAAVGSRPVRAQATAGGNVAANKSCGDLLPVLVALGARLHLASVEGERELPVEQFLLAPDRMALIAAMVVPRPAPTTRVARQRFSRSVNDLATVQVALGLELEAHTIRRVRLAAGGVAPTVVRLARAEQVLDGADVPADLAAGAGPIVELSERLAEATGAEATPIDDVRGSADFKREIAGVLAARALTACLGSQGGSR